MIFLFLRSSGKGDQGGEILPALAPTNHVPGLENTSYA
jgi:hypothetical protein